MSQNIMSNQKYFAGDEPRDRFVTIIMPVRNEGSFIARSLGAVLSQDYPKDRFEVIVADGMSTDGTRDFVESMQSEFANLRLVDNPGKIVPTGMNAGIVQARGEIIVRVDGHTVIEPDYVTQCVRALERSGADNAGGRMDAVAEGEFGKAVAVATSSPFGVGGARFHYSDKEEWVDTVYMGAWRRETFRSVGLFDEEMVRNQDDEFNYRLLAQNGKILLSPKIKSRYYNRASLGALRRQYFQYGYWKVRVMQKHPRQMRLRQFAPPAFTGLILLLSLTALFFSAARLGLALIGGAYIACDLAASVAGAAKSDWRRLSLLPFIFPVLHFAYGAGFLVGLGEFWNRWTDTAGRFSPLATVGIQKPAAKGRE